MSYHFIQMEEELKEELVIDPLKEASHHSKLEPKSLKVSNQIDLPTFLSNWNLKMTLLISV